MSTEELAQRVWDIGKPLKGPVVEAYYGWRGLAVPETRNLRFVASLKHYNNGGSYPAIIARAENLKGVMTGIQRTWLAHDGSGKAPVPKKRADVARPNQGRRGSPRGARRRRAAPSRRGRRDYPDRHAGHRLAGLGDAGHGGLEGGRSSRQRQGPHPARRSMAARTPPRSPRSRRT